MKSRAYQTTPTPVLDLLPSLLTTKTNRPLVRLGGNRSLFASLARRFGKDGAVIVTSAQAALQQGDRVVLAREMHTLKGLAATLGATELARLAAAAEAAFVSPDRVVPSGNGHEAGHLAQLATAVEAAAAMMNAAADAINPPHAVQSGPLDMERILEHLDALDVLLAKQNMRSLAVFDTLKHEAGDTFAESLAPLDEALFKLDFTAAREIAAQLKGTLTR